MANTSVEEIFLEIMMVAEGIAPFSSRTVTNDVNRALIDVSPDEARKMRRKFRKLWRKISPHLIHKGKQLNKPSKHELLSRKMNVLGHFSREAGKKTKEVLKKGNGDAQ